MRQRRRSFLRSAGLAAGGALLPLAGDLAEDAAAQTARPVSAAAAHRSPSSSLSAEGHRHQLGPRQRDVAGPLPARNLRRRLRVHRLRRRRLDGPLPGQQRAVGLLHPCQADQERALQEQPGRHVHRRDRPGRRAGRHVRHGRGGRRLRQRRPRRHDRHRLRQADALPQQRQRHLHRRHQDGRPRQPRAGRRARSGSTTTTTASSTSSSAASSSSRARRTSSAATTSWGAATTASRASSSRRPACCSSNNGNGTFTKTSTGTDIERALGKALGVVATDVNGDGLMDLFVANDTVQNFLFANRGKGKWEELGLSAEVAFSANGQPRSGMGVDAADFDQDGLQDLFVANVDQEMFSLYKNRGGESFADVAHANGDRAGDAAALGLGPEVLRLRQRRPARSDAGQRPPRRHDRAVLHPGEVRRAAAAVPQRGRQAAGREQGRRSGRSAAPFRPAASPSATSATTAASTS